MPRPHFKEQTGKGHPLASALLLPVYYQLDLSLLTAARLHTHPTFRRCRLALLDAAHPQGAEGSSLDVNDQLATYKSNANVSQKACGWRLFLTPLVMPKSLPIDMGRQRRERCHTCGDVRI